MSLFEEYKQLPVIIPANIESVPYQDRVEKICKELNIPRWLDSSWHIAFKYMENSVFYISDLHLDHIVSQRCGHSPSANECINCIKDIVHGLLTSDIRRKLSNGSSPIFIFGGDIAADFEFAQIFFAEFVAQCEKENERISGPYYIFAVLGNHEFWNFDCADECYRAYSELFDNLNITFLNNSIAWFGSHKFPIKRIETKNKDKYKYVELKKEDDEENYYRQMKDFHNILIVGGVGFSEYNDSFNANQGIYRRTISRQQEIEETHKWIDVYNNALTLSKEENCILVVLTHNPISDWLDKKTGNANCIYFNGHNHHNFMHHNVDQNTHIYANNQIGYEAHNPRFKEALIFNRINPFAYYADGVHEINSSDYLKFYDYMNSDITGNKTVERYISNGAHFYMIKQNEYYGFFLVSLKGTYICVGGRIKKISKSTDIQKYYMFFEKMVSQYLKKFAPFRKVQNKISNTVKAFGGVGTIHGCIIDIDFENHIMLNPFDGSVTFYHSPVWGQIEPHKNMLSLLNKHNEKLADNYRKLLETSQNCILEKTPTQLAIPEELINIDIKNSIYSISNRIYQIQRLFDKRILRDWNDELLTDDTDWQNSIALPK